MKLGSREKVFAKVLAVLVLVVVGVIVHDNWYAPIRRAEYLAERAAAESEERSKQAKQAEFDEQLKQKYQPKNFTLKSFSGGICSTGIPQPSDPDGKTAPPTFEVKWTNADTLAYREKIEVGCGYYFPFGRYSVEKDTLVLEYAQRLAPIPGQPGAQIACLCQYWLTFTITGLKRDDYKIVVRPLAVPENAPPKP